MASVAICPHCYLQLVVPDGVEPGERVECPTCAKEFGLDQAVLRPIPEVVRRSQTTPEVAPAAAASDVVEEDVAEEIDEIVIQERVIEISPPVAPEPEFDSTRYLEEIKARIEASIAEKGLVPGTNTFLSLDEPALSMDSTKPADEITSEESVEDPLSAFRNARTVAEFPAFEDEIERRREISIDLDPIQEKTDEPLAAVEETGVAADELGLEPVEERDPQPTVRTLADWMQPLEEDSEQDEPLADERAEEIEAAVEGVVEENVEDDEFVEEAEVEPGPSFDLPNVPLVPNTSATVEFDPSMSFGPAAETEFEFDDVSFEPAPAEETFANEPSDEVAEESQPVFPESKSELPSAPFVLPGVPRPRKNRSIVRVLVGTALGALVGLSLGYLILLYVLGPEGDLLKIAKYIPSAALPKSFQTSTSVAEAEVPPVAAPEHAPAEVEVAADEKPAAEESSANIPAGYVEETPVESGALATDESDDDNRYGSEPAPLEEPAAEPITEETPAATVSKLPLHGPTFTVEQLATALEAGNAALPGLVNGDLSDGAVRKTKGASYEKLSELAEVLTFVDSSTPSVESEDATSGADHLFAEIFSNPHTLSEIDRIVSIWVPSPHRSNSGIFFAGTTSGGQIAGDVYEYEVATEEGGKFTLLSSEPLEPATEGSSRPVGIVGAIVDNPAQNVTGYSGTAKRAIWLTRAIPLE